MMILTYKLKHNRNFKIELFKAKQIADFALKTKSRSSKDVKHFGLKSVISNQILKKYSINKKLKRISKVKLTIPNQGIKFKDGKVFVSSLKLEIPFERIFEKINQIELDDIYAYISCSVQESPSILPTSWLGVDLNTTGHCVVIGNPSNGKVLKLGKKPNHTHKKYSKIRKNLQKKKKFSALKTIKKRESNIIRNLNHQISNKIVKEAVSQNAGIVLEDLTGIRKTKSNRSFRYSLNSWSFYQLRQFIWYKARLHGISVALIDPRYSSQQCSKCGLLGERNKKQFKCSCGHVDHADSNASFVLALRHQCMIQSIIDRDMIEGPLTALKRIGKTKLPTIEPPSFTNGSSQFSFTAD